MLHGTVQGLFKLLGALGMVIFLTTVWTVYRLSQGPFSLSHLTPYVERALSRPGDGRQVRIADTILTWNRESHSLEILVVQVRLVGADGAVIAAFPEMSVSLSGQALLHGRLVPRTVGLLNPVLRLLRDEQGVIRFGIGVPGDDSDSRDDNGAGELARAAFAALLAPPGGETIAGQLQSLRVVGGSLLIEDRLNHVRWTAPSADLTLSRDQRGLSFKAGLDLDLEGHAGRLDASGLYRLADQQLDLRLAGKALRLASLAKLSPRLTLLGAARLPISGSLALGYRFGGPSGEKINALKADLTLGSGSLDLDSWSDFRVPVHSGGLSVAYDGERLTLQNGRIDVDGSVMTAEGSIDGMTGDRKTELRVQFDSVALDRLSTLWPKSVAPHPRAWMIANMTKGRIEAIDASISGHVTAGHPFDDFELDRIDGGMLVKDATVRYAPSLPAVDHVGAEARFDADHFDIALQGGDVAGLALLDGRVILAGLSNSDQDARITLRIAGGITNIMRFIDNPPLRWAHRLGLEPSQLGGDAMIALGLDFPLVDGLSFDQLRIKVAADGRAMSIPHVLGALDLTDGVLHFAIDNAGLDASGTAQIDHRAATLAWHENFGAAPFVSRYQVGLLLSDQGRVQAGLDVAPLQPPYLSGVVPVALTVVIPVKGRTDISLSADLTPALIALPGLNYRKLPGLNAGGTASLHLNGERLTDLLQFHLQGAANLDLEGDLSFAAGQPKHLALRRGNWARSQMAGTIDFEDDGLKVRMGGASFDARELLADHPSDPVTDRAPEPKPPPPPHRDQSDHTVTPLTIDGSWKQVWLSDQGAIDRVTAALRRDRHRWAMVGLDARVTPDKTLAVALDQAGENRSRLTVDCDDAGALLRAMDIFTTMQGGGLSLAALSDDANPARPFEGSVRITDFQLVQAPILAKLLTVAGLTGIGDLLSGQGIHFAKLDVPFRYQDGVLQLHDGRAAGNALGVTAKGQIDFDQDVIAVEGTLVPAYVINSALGGLPLLGGLFAREPGGGVLAINYRVSGPIDQPSVSVNPLSALTPGFLRGFFDLFGSAPPTEAH